MTDLNLMDFQRTGTLQSSTPLLESQLGVLRTEYLKAEESKQRLHYNQLSGLHNPWGKSSHFFDSWALLDICQSDAILQRVKPLIGPDIVLWESAFYGFSALNAHNSWSRHSDFSPVYPMQGITVRIAIGPSDLKLDYLPDSQNTEDLNKTPSEPAETVSIKAGHTLCHDTRLAHRYSKTTTNLLCGEYVIHYMPATSLFVRDPASAIQKHLAEKIPLINYGKSPIWLVCGNDHCNNDFVTGFSPPVGQWTAAQW